MPDWSPDGKYLFAYSKDFHHLMLFDFNSGKWSEAAKASFGDVYFSHDSRFIYFENADEAAIYRASLPGLKIERVAALKELRRPALVYWDMWTGLTPDDSVLAMRDLGIQEVYALDLQP